MEPQIRAPDLGSTRTQPQTASSDAQFGVRMEVIPIQTIISLGP